MISPYSSGFTHGIMLAMHYGDEKNPTSPKASSGQREKLDRLERKLYSRNTPDIIGEARSQFKDGGTKQETKENWQNIKTSNFDELAARFSRAAEKQQSFVKKIFIFSALFFVIASGAAVFVFWGGMNMVSSKNVDIKVVGPLSVGGGQEVSFDIDVINNNNVDLNSASLLVKYPEGSRSAADLSKELDQERFALGSVKSRESYSQNIKVIFFGEKEDLKQIKISLEYRVENSSALFYKEKVHEISISSSPVIITPTYPKEVNSNQETTFNIEVASNSKDEIKNFLVNVEYPFGFVFKESSPSASYGNNIWKFSSLKPGEKKVISIKGSIIGQDSEEKVFKINTGTASENDERTIAVMFLQLTESILVKKPFISMSIFIEGKEGNFVAKGGGQIVTEFAVKNNLPSRLFNTSVQVSFRGGAFNKTGVFPGNDGFFQSFDSSILWDKRSVPEFTDMGPGSEKRLSFRLTPLLYENVATGAKPEIEITITVKGERILESGSVEQVSAVETRKIVLATDLYLSSRTVRSVGNIENSGPIPPRVDTPTTYTVVWSISNSFNQASNVEVRATLPSYVNWTNLKNPQNEIFSFNAVSNEVVWNVGSVLPSTGFGSPKKEIYFQLEFLPSLSQVGQAPVILGEAFISGIDKITGSKIESKVSEITTDFSGDPSFRPRDDRVVQ